MDRAGEAQGTAGARARGRGTAAGVPAASIETLVSEPFGHHHAADAVADDIVATARARRYGAVVVKRGQTTAIGEDLGAALAARATAVTLCLVK